MCQRFAFSFSLCFKDLFWPVCIWIWETLMTESRFDFRFSCCLMTDMWEMFSRPDGWSKWISLDLLWCHCRSGVMWLMDWVTYCYSQILKISWRHLCYCLREMKQLTGVEVLGDSFGWSNLSCSWIMQSMWSSAQVQHYSLISSCYTHCCSRKLVSVQYVSHSCICNAYQVNHWKHNKMECDEFPTFRNRKRDKLWIFWLLIIVPLLFLDVFFASK